MAAPSQRITSRSSRRPRNTADRPDGPRGTIHCRPPTAQLAKESALARAKNTDRAEARRRYRATQLSAELPNDDADEIGAEEEPQQPARRGFQLPDFRADLAAVPGLFRRKRLLWIPLLLVISGFAATFIRRPDGTLDPTVEVYTTFVLGPSALAPSFLAGFLAQRASYLVGGLVGLVNGILTLVLLAMLTSEADREAARLGETLGVPALQPDASIWLVAYAVIFGGLIGAFASWYRRFLQTGTSRRRAAQEARARAQRRDSKRSRPASR